jgi:hypothetical protein
MSDKPKTAVQWLRDKLNQMENHGADFGEDYKSLKVHMEKALAMERENSCKFATRYEDYCWRVSQNNRYDTPMTAEQYYTETYGE